MRKLLALVVIMVAGLATAAAFADTTTFPSGATGTLEGNYTVETNGVVKLVSNANSQDPNKQYGAVVFSVATGTTLADLETMAATWKGCAGGGSPRFSVELANGKNIFVYIGDAPNFTTCTEGWADTGNLIGTSDTDLRWDTSQLTGGSFYDNYGHAITLAGDEMVKQVDLVVDAGWFFEGRQTIRIKDANFAYNAPITPETFTQVNRLEACASKPILRAGDGSMGIYADLDEATYKSGTFQGVTFTAALYVQGVGLTCDVPAGYTYAGHTVDGSGGTSGGDSQIYPLYTK